MIGRTVAHFNVLSKLGEGGMGVVYKAYDTRLDRPVALKVVSQSEVSEELASRFALEARAAAAINHPSVCTIYSIEEHEDRRFIAMELVEGETLRRRLRERNLPLGTAIRYAEQIAEGLAAAHAKGVVHRDIKPENLIVTPEDRIKITDFGLAKLKGGPGVTRADSRVGTLLYMAPEQVRGDDIDHRVDIWALGAVFYEMLAGRPPFQGANEAEVLYGILNREPAPVSDHRPEVPPPLLGLLGRMLEKDPAARTADVGEVVASIQRQHEEPTRVSVPVPPPQAADNSVAILDFINLTADSETDWLGGGIAETVTVDLKKASSLQVVSRERVLQALGASGEDRLDEHRVIAVGQELGVRWILWGAFQRLGGAVRITAHFTEARSGELVGSAKIDGSMEQIFELQDRIIRELLQILDVEVDSSELERMKAPHTNQPTAYEAYARGRQELWRFSPESLALARRHFEQALEVDPTYALAHSGLGAAHMFHFIANTEPESLETAIHHLERALELDPQLGEAHQWLAYAHLRTRQYERGTLHGRRASELEPSSYFAPYFLACNHMALGLMEYREESLGEAARELRRSIRIEPDYQWNYLWLSWLCLLYGRYEEGRAYVEKALVIDREERFKGPRAIGAHPLAGFIDYRAADRKAAEASLERAIEILSGLEHVYRFAMLALSHYGLGRLHAERERYGDAVARYEEALRLLEENPRALGGGAYLVRVLCARAAVFHQMGLKREAKESFSRARDLFEKREGYDFSLVPLGADAELLYELAACQGPTGQAAATGQTLGRAIDCGFRDGGLLERDEAFRTVRSSPELSRVIERLRELGPPPHLLDPLP